VKVDYRFLKELAEESGSSGAFSELPQLFNESPNDFLNTVSIVMESIYKKHYPDRDSSIKIVVRIYNTQEFNIPTLEDIKSSLINKLVAITGNVLRVSSINLLVTSMKFFCVVCNNSTRVRFNNGKYEPLTICANPECCGKNLIADRASAHSIFYQRIRIQEIDTELVSAGKMPKTIECELQDDLVDCCVSGDIVEVSGILYPELTTDNTKSKGIFSSYLEVNSVVHKNCAYNASSQIEEVEVGDEKVAKEIASKCNVLPLLIKSLCPQIYGQELIKFGLLLSLFGGTNTYTRNKTRSDIHTLLVGDPGMGKSQLLQYLVKISPRGFYVCGKSTTTAGLTVAICKDQVSNEQTLEAGALVLSDLGLCCIDEFDKMSSDYSTLLEAMEQQTISVAKGGMLCSLAARCAIIAAANPCYGKYNPENSIMNNIRLSTAVLSRFDLVFVLLDNPDEVKDKKLTEHVLALHNKRRRESDECGLMHKAKRLKAEEHRYTKTITIPTEHKRLSDKLNQSVGEVETGLSIEEVRKYVAYARGNINPKLSLEACREIKRFYIQIREIEAEKGLHSTAFPITTRLLESLIRLSQARAKLELRDHVNKQDTQEVIELVMECIASCSANQGYCRMGSSGRQRINLRDVSNLSRKKQTECFIEKLRMEIAVKGNDVFEYKELVKIGKELKMNVGNFADYINELNATSLLLLKGAQKYKLPND